jgi:sec-independent protein translocase protein TatC
MVALFMLAVGIAYLNDRRRARRAAAEGWGDLADDEASPLDSDAGYDPYDEVDAQAGDRPTRP